jgi:negative regulator of sigma-B (phosphoserine phosphatase)
VRAGGWSRPFRGLAACGDEFLAEVGADGFLAAVIDGLGHGHEASLAATRAVEAIRQTLDLGVEEIILHCHEAMRETRGAAVGVLKVDAAGKGSFCGVGNIDVIALAGASPGLFCSAGIVGHNLRRCRAMPFAMKPGDVICLLSDGVSTRGDLAFALPGEPVEVARRIVEKFGRDHDDATALVMGFSAEALLGA